MKRVLFKIFFDDLYTKLPMRNYETNKIIYNHDDEILSIDLADLIDYKTSNYTIFRYIFIIIDSF